MTKEEFLKKCKKTLKRKKVKIKNRREGAMNNQEDINLCDFPGIYIILQDDKVIYIGSAEAGERCVSDRLKQYWWNSATGNTLANALVRKNGYSFSDALEDIKKCKVLCLSIGNCLC